MDNKIMSQKRRGKEMTNSLKKIKQDLGKKSQNKPSIWEEQLSEETKAWLIKVGTISSIVVGAIVFGPFLMNILKKNVIAFKQLRFAIKAKV